MQDFESGNKLCVGQASCKNESVRVVVICLSEGVLSTAIPWIHVESLCMQLNLTGFLAHMRVNPS